MERGPRGSEMSSEARAVLRAPEQAFDSSLEEAEEQSRRVIARLVARGETLRTNKCAEFTTMETGGHAPPGIQIVWPAPDSAYVLRLVPYAEGRGVEQGVFGYSGEYGPAERHGAQYEFTHKSGLQELFGVPHDIEVIFVPTRNRWAVETTGDPTTTAIFGANARKMYLGLGFLFLGREWMHIGAHEAGHLPNNHDENSAWQIANAQYATIHRPRKVDILAGREDGRFGLLKQPIPTSYGSTPRLGDITKYGLVSHAAAGQARIPSQWNGPEILQDFRKIITAADEAYMHFIGR